MKDSSKKRRPVSRTFWKFLRYMPPFLRASFLRAQFQVDYNLPEELVLKQAETESEIKQALTLVHDAYVELGYMAENKLRIRFSKFLALPTTVILIAKWKEEVIGTISIVSDSGFGLPSDPVWTDNKLRSQGELLAEISTLCIKKDFSFRRGRLLMGLCKIMYLYCTQILKVDTIVASTTTEVEPFYTDILLFESLKNEKGNAHHMVNGNPSFFGYLSLNKNLEAHYKKIYGKKKQAQNLHHYFFEAQSPWIHLPKMKTSLQSYLSHKNKAVNEIILKNESLVKDFTQKDLDVIQNLDVPVNLPFLKKTQLLRRPRPRFDIRTPAIAFVDGSKIPEPCKIINISENGIQIKLDQSHSQDLIGKPILIVFEHEKEWISCQASVRWLESQKRLGCMIGDKSHSWKKFVDLVWSDTHESVNKKAA